MGQLLWVARKGGQVIEEDQCVSTAFLTQAPASKHSVSAPPAPVSECRGGTGVPDIHNIDAIKAEEICELSARPRGRGCHIQLD